MKFPYRSIARIIVEAKTPLAIGSDDVKEDQDSPVTKDFNGLPYIPGTAIAGWLRTKLKNLDDLFGEKPDSDNDEPEGSNIITSDAYLLDNDYQVHQQVEKLNKFFDKFKNLPIRQHVAINHLGAAKDSALFDREIVYKGSRFKFEIALELEKENNDAWQQILNAFYADDFYIGGGQFDGFGELEVVEIKEAKFNLELEKDLDFYLNISVDLNSDTSYFETFSPKGEKEKNYDEITYTLTGENSFHHFGAGYGDIDVDQVNYKEEVIIWNNNKPNFVEKYVIPATSIKGVLAHRVAYYYNVENGKFVENLIGDIKENTEKQLQQKYNVSHIQPADTIEALQKQKVELKKILAELENETFKPENLFDDVIGENNQGVAELFGRAKNSNKQTGHAGKVIIKDIYLNGDLKEHIFYHNKIDRFTGGTVDSALYSEKVLHIPEAKLCIKVKKDTPTGNLNKALADLTQGKLPVGGLVNKGHGMFNLKTKENDDNSNNK